MAIGAAAGWRLDALSTAGPDRPIGEVPGEDEAATARLRSKFRRCLAPAPPLQVQSGASTDVADPLFDGPLKQAAVLVPLVMRPTGLSVLLTRRTDHLDSHAGQISFPGGRVERHDADYTATALRETEEETGLAREFVDVVGALDEYLTGTGYSVIPVVGLVRPGFRLSPDEFEVSEIFEVPCSFALDPRNHQRRSARLRGRRRRFYVIEYEARWIWGATAAMLVNLHDRLAAGGVLPDVISIMS
jgi:8-oxo-dGTP pyrophosphatase MutT (NUDIX family)